MKLSRTVAVAAIAVTVALTPMLAGATPSPDRRGVATTTPIEHLAVIFQENISFDHYFGTYPNAANPPGEPRFVAKPGTPSVNGLGASLLTANPNAANPVRLDRTEALTCDQNHGYTAEQQAAHLGLMDKFVEFTSVDTCSGSPPRVQKPNLVMDYYDGNTVTALWNYAQRYAMSDNSFDTVFGPSTPGHINLVSGQTHGIVDSTPNLPAREAVEGTMIGDPQPLGDACSSRDAVRMGGRNVGDLLNAEGVTWGWFQGGFADCTASHLAGTFTQGQQTSEAVRDYIPHHQPFQYYASTANPNHLPPTAVDMIGRQDQANHQYDLPDFWAAADHGNLPAVSFLKAPAYQDGHAGYSDPLDEQRFLVETINHLQRLPEWRSTAVVIAYDDSDGWYDHQMSPIVNQSQSSADALTGDGQCGDNPSRVDGGYQGRCGYGPRQPLLVVSNWARQNFVDHTITDQTSVLRFIEDNWQLGRIGDHSFDAKAGPLDNLFDFTQHGQGSPFILDPATGQPTTGKR